MILHMTGRSRTIFPRIYLLLILLPLTGISQTLSTQNKKAEKCFFSAIDSYQSRNNPRALSEVDRALELDPGFTEAWILKGDILSGEKQLEKAIEAYSAAIRTNNPFSPNLFRILGEAQMKTGQYAGALDNFRRFAETPGLSDALNQQAQELIRNASFAKHCVDNPVPFQPVNLGDSINTGFDEYINALSTDEAILFFTRKDPRDNQTIAAQLEFEEDFYSASRKDTVWLRARNLGPPVNTHGNEGALCISPDGNYLFFAACNREDGYGSCDLYWARKTGNDWSEPVNLGDGVNSSQWDSQPTFSSDGKTLYFSSKRPGGKGSSDIWMTVLNPDGSWSAPENLGDSVNTRAEEMAPFIHQDNQTLYFSSKGHTGLGGYDLFLTRRNPGGTWGRPQNLGYPINTFSDQLTLIVNAAGNAAYISSDLAGGKGKQDIYSFPLYPAARPNYATYFKGIVFDRITGEKLEAQFELIDLAGGSVAAMASSDQLTGEFLLTLPANRNYALNVSRDGYLFFSDRFFLQNDTVSGKPVVRDVPLQPIRLGEITVLKNVYFDTDKYILKQESVAELDRLSLLLKKNPAIKIEISGHTDNQGTAAHNLILSENRAKAVYDFLVGRGIDASRLSFRGYGMEKPIDDNATDSGRANNRRTEFKVVGN